MTRKNLAPLLLGLGMSVSPVGTVAAQTVTVEGGASALNRSVEWFQDARSAGGFLGVGVDVPGATWLVPYLNVSGSRSRYDSAFKARTGIALRLARGFVRPVLRAGWMFDDGVTATGGVGVYVGRQTGGLVTVDWSSTRYDLTYRILSIGGYYRFD